MVRISQKVIENLTTYDNPHFNEGDEPPEGYRPCPLTSDKLQTIDARRAFAEYINLLKTPEYKAQVAPNGVIPKLKLSELLGDDGLTLFKRALEEEANSQAFKEAVWNHSLSRFNVDVPDNKKPLIVLTGASATGKSSAQKPLVEKKYNPNPEKNAWMVSIDGGVPREINKVQQMVKLWAEESGVQIADLHANSERYLSGIKKEIETKAWEDETLGIIIPATFASDANPFAKTMRDDIKESVVNFNANNANTKVDMTVSMMVAPDDALFKRVVKIQGESRAYESASLLQKLHDAFFENRQSKDISYRLDGKAVDGSPLKEAKEYDETKYGWGTVYSWKAMKEFLGFAEINEAANVSVVYVVKDSALYNKQGLPIWEGENVEGAIIASPKMAGFWNDWRTKSLDKVLEKYELEDEAFEDIKAKINGAFPDGCPNFETFAIKSRKIDFFGTLVRTFTDVQHPFKEETLSIFSDHIGKASGARKIFGQYQHHNNKVVLLELDRILSATHSPNDADYKTSLEAYEKAKKELDENPLFVTPEELKSSQSTKNLVVDVKKYIESRLAVLRERQDLENKAKALIERFDEIIAPLQAEEALSQDELKTLNDAYKQKLALEENVIRESMTLGGEIKEHDINRRNMAIYALRQQTFTALDEKNKAFLAQQLNKPKDEKPEFLKSNHFSKFDSQGFIWHASEPGIKPHMIYEVDAFSTDEGKKNLLSALTGAVGEKHRDALDALYTSHRHSIRNIEKELRFHYAQLCNSIQKAANEGQAIPILTDETINKVYESLMANMLTDVKARFNLALKDSIEGGRVNLQKLNETLDRGIVAINEENYPKLQKAIRQHVPGLLINEKLLQKYMESSVAFSNSLIHRIEKNKHDEILVNHLRGYEVTAHTDGEGPASMDLSIDCFKDGELQPKYKTERTSLIVTHKKDTREAVNETAAFIGQMMARRDSPSIYNLLTSVHDFWGELAIDGSNKQTERAKILIKAQDEYNKTAPIDRLFLTLHIPVNLSGYEMQKVSTWRNPLSGKLINEISFRNDLAMALILYGKNDARVKEILKTYQAFLNSASKEDQLHLSAQALSITTQLHALKEAEALVNRDEPRYKQLARAELFELFKAGSAGTHENAKRAQAYALLLNENSFVGCKSANERTALIEGRVESIIREFEGQQAIDVQNFNQKVDAIFNDNGLYAGNSTIALQDQGAIAKIEAWWSTSWKVKVIKMLNYIFGTNFDTNRAEGDNMTHLVAKSAGKMQAHKNEDAHALLSEAPDPNLPAELSGQERASARLDELEVADESGNYAELEVGDDLDDDELDETSPLLRKKQQKASLPQGSEGIASGPAILPFAPAIAQQAKIHGHTPHARQIHEPIKILGNVVKPEDADLKAWNVPKECEYQGMEIFLKGVDIYTPGGNTFNLKCRSHEFITSVSHKAEDQSLDLAETIANMIDNLIYQGVETLNINSSDEAFKRIAATYIKALNDHGVSVKSTLSSQSLEESSEIRNLLSTRVENMYPDPSITRQHRL